MLQVAVMNPQVPGGIMLVPAASVYAGAPPAAAPAAPAQHMLYTQPQPAGPAYGYPHNAGGGVPSGFSMAPQQQQQQQPAGGGSFANLTSPYLAGGKR